MERPCAIVSMPCWELFEQQEQSYQDEVLTPGIPAVVAEAGIRQGWDRWVGSRGGFVTVDRFGASAPYKLVYEKLGITVERVVAEAQRLLS